MAIKFVCFLSLLFFSISCFAQQQIETGGMYFTYEVKGDSVFCFLQAPTEGWVMIGFNNKNAVQNADLKFFAIENNKLNYSDRKNTGGRNYPSDIELKGKNDLSIYFFKETRNKTTVAFSFPIRSNDPNDYNHKINESLWLILAYSVEDDFQHHSRVRKHLPFKWETL